MKTGHGMDLPAQNGKLAVITGATGGLGFETALALARAGADVIVSGRNEAKGRDAVRRIRDAAGHVDVRFERLDLARLDSVARFGDRLRSDRRPVDILINNAGVMALPTRQETVDGFEMQFGTNYLGHFALTAQLWPLLGQARVVNLSSLAHRVGRIDFDDPHARRRYRPWERYAQSKLAMLMFTFELQRRSTLKQWGLLSYAAHPGWARTDLVTNGRGNRGPLVMLSRWLSPLFGQSAAEGARPTLFAATSLEARPAGYYGPDGCYEMKGAPRPAKVMPQARDADVATRLWTLSSSLTQVAWPDAPADDTVR